MRRALGFTVVELLIVALVISILAAITTFGFSSWRRNVATTAAKSDISTALSALKSYENFNQSYPPNMAGTTFAAATTTAVTLYTNAPSLGVYSNLTNDQNAQLFLNVCNANLEGTNNTSCVFNGHNNGAKIHVKGTTGTNAIWRTDIAQTDVVLTCGTACNTATNSMINQFLAQGGTFPIVLSGDTVSLPEPDQVPNGDATEFCVQSQSADYSDVVFHATQDSDAPVSGACNDPNLHYYP